MWEQDAIEVLQRFCAAFANRDARALREMVGADDLVVVTSQEALLRGPAEFERFVDRYVAGPTTYSWDWDRYDVSLAGSIACILAEGTETAAGGNHREQHPYRMTMVLERSRDRWLVRQVHGSVPQPSA